jgi:hypothetical protein
MTMATLTSAQIAELLLGIARSQQAIIEAMENSKAGFKSTHFRPSIETAARIRTNRAETLADFPSRLLLQMLGRTGPDAAQVTKELEALLSRPPAAVVPGAASAPAPGVTGPA